MGNQADSSFPEALPGATAVGLLERAHHEVMQVVVGQEVMVERMIIGLLAGGHVLLEGVPGVAKSLAVRTLATVVGGAFTRIHLTSDTLSPSVGTDVSRPAASDSRPLFANFVLVDDVTGASSRAQWALLDAMAERQVIVDGSAHPLPDLFVVVATHNPARNITPGPLPQAQRDRFLMKVTVAQGSEAEELAIVERMSGHQPVARQVLSLPQVLALRHEARQVFVHPAIARYCVHLMMATRYPRQFGISTLDGILEYGVSSRGSLGLIAAARAHALLRGRDYVLAADIGDLALDVLTHRLALTAGAVSNHVDPRDVIRTILSAVPRPHLAAIEPSFRAAQAPSCASSSLPPAGEASRPVAPRTQGGSFPRGPRARKNTTE